MRADLHLHSNRSDGSSSIADLIRIAKRMKLGCIAVSDHDTMSGVEEASALGRENGITVIPAVEITTCDSSRGKRPVHLLCYLPQDAGRLQSFCNVTLQNRWEQKMLMIEKISKLYPITLDDVLKYSADSDSIYECHIMRPLADMGYTAPVIGPLARELIYSGGSCYSPSHYPDVHDTLTVIRDCGGISVVAHAGQFDSMDLVEELASSGRIDGVELWHPRNPPKIRAKLESAALRYGLITTGGSDFHGNNAEAPHPMGYCGCNEQSVERLLQLSRRGNG